jgi:hypothetical protein
LQQTKKSLDKISEQERNRLCCWKSILAASLHPAWLPQHGKVQGKNLGVVPDSVPQIFGPPWLNINKTK